MKESSRVLSICCIIIFDVLNRLMFSFGVQPHLQSLVYHELNICAHLPLILVNEKVTLAQQMPRYSGRAYTSGEMCSSSLSPHHLILSPFSLLTFIPVFSPLFHLFFKLPALIKLRSTCRRRAIRFVSSCLIGIKRCHKIHPTKCLRLMVLMNYSFVSFVQRAV